MNPQSLRFTVFLASIAALTSLSIDMSLPALPAIEHEFGRAAGQGGLTLSLFLAGYAFTPLVGGPLADRFGRRPVLLISLVCFALSALACSLSPDFTLLLIFRMLQGCASGVATTLPLAIVRDLLRGSAARQRISEVTTINSIMPIIAPVFGSTVMVSGWWRLIFGCQAAFTLCIIIALLIDFGESLPSDKRASLNASDLIHNYVQLLRNSAFLSYSLINGLTFACIFSFISASPLILMQRMGVSRHTYTLLFTLLGGGTITGSLLSVFLTRRHISSHRIIRSGLLLMGTTTAAAVGMQIAGLHKPAFLLPLVFSTLFGFGLIAPSVTFEALDPVPDLAGSGSGALRAILMSFGSGASAFLAAFCSRNFVHTELATTLTMFFTVLTASCVYIRLRHYQAQPR